MPTTEGLTHLGNRQHASIVLGAVALLIAGCSQSGTPNKGAALEGVISSTEEGTMEGVVVSARKPGSTITVSVVSDADGHYRFPADRLASAKYTLTIRAAGYELPAPVEADVESGKAGTADLKLVKTTDLAAQLSNAEWLISMPGDAQDKDVFQSCTDCHSLERIARSKHSADEFIQVMQRMAAYAYNTKAEAPQMAPRAAVPTVEHVKVPANYLAGINLFGRNAWPYPLKTLPRVKGRGANVVITEYDLPDPLIQPHDVLLDGRGQAWFTDFGRPVIGRLDPETGKVKEFPIPLLIPDAPVGSLDIRRGQGEDLWITTMYQNAIGRFNMKTEQWRTYPLPDEFRRPGSRIAHFAVNNMGVDGKIWLASSVGFLRLDTESGKYESVHPFNGSPYAFQTFNLNGGTAPFPSEIPDGPDWTEFYNRKVRNPDNGETVKPGKFSGIPAPYGLVTDSKNNLYALDFGANRIVKIDAKTLKITNFITPSYASRARRGHIDANDNLWFAEYNANRIARLNTKTGEMKEFRLKSPWSSPYDVVPDKTGQVWAAGMNTDRVSRLDPKSGEIIEYPLPRFTNVRRVFIDDRAERSVFWIGSNHGASIVKVEPLD